MDAFAGIGSNAELKPFFAYTLLICCQDLDTVTFLYGVACVFQLSIDASAQQPMTDVRVDAVGEVNNR